jgi:hypothetical protein
MFKYSNTNKRYYTLDYFYKNKFNSKVFKVSLNAGFTCPNKDGKVGTKGCIYCSKSGSGEYAGNVKKVLLKTETMEVTKTLTNNALAALFLVLCPLYNKDAVKTYVLDKSKLEISPTYILSLPFINTLSNNFTHTMANPGIGPNINPPKIQGSSAKSSFINAGAKNNGILNIIRIALSAPNKPTKQSTCVVNFTFVCFITTPFFPKII